MIIYLKYPQKRGFFSWDELSLVARTLGFDGDLFRRNFPAFIACQTDGIPVKLLLELFCDSTCLHSDVDATANFHFFPWNISVIHKTILLLNERLLTFAEIHLVRVAYLFYEGIEAKGLPLDGNILQKTLKLCGRMMSPQKMSQRLFHMIPRLQEPGFLQLHDFLDLVLWTDLYNPRILKKTKRLGITKDGDGCFQMSNFEELLQTVDSRLLTTLDSRYKVEECTYSESRSMMDTTWKQDVTESYINPTFRLTRVPKARSDFGHLTKKLNQSRSRVKQSMFGYSCRPTTATPLKVTQRVRTSSPSKIQVKMDSPLAKTSGMQEESAERRSKPRVMSSRSASDDTTDIRDKTEVLPPKAASSKYRVPSIVSDEDLQKTSKLIDDLKFDDVTLATRCEHLIDNIWLRRTRKDNSNLDI